MTDLWRALFDHDAVREAFVGAVRSFAAGQTYLDVHEALEAREIDVHDGVYRSLVARTADGDKNALWRLLHETRALGSGQSSVADLHAVAGLFDALEDGEPLTLVVDVDRDAFEALRRDQREDVCQLLARLSRGLDVRLVGSRVTLAWLAHEHGDDLPGVSEWRTTPREGGPSTDSIVDDALEELDPNGRVAKTLRTLADEPAETLPYGDLYALSPEVRDSRIRQCIQPLVDLDLVDTFGPRTDRRVELLETGRRVVAALDAEIGRQIELDDCVSDTGKNHPKTVLPPDRDGGEGEEPYQTAYADRPNHAAAAASGLAADVCLATEPARDSQNRANHRVRLVSYDEDHDEAVVSVRATTPLQHTVSVALALASPRLLDRALPVDRLGAAVTDDPAPILRDARCIGALSDEALEDPAELREALVSWANDLAELTTRLHRTDDFDECKELRSTIMRSAHGLAGSLVHLLDVAGVDVVRELRIPAGLDRDAIDALTRSIAVSATIQSKYGAFAPYRHHFETDAGTPPLSPRVDAADPCGSLIGSFVLRGPDVERLRPALETWLKTPSDPRDDDDRPEFAVDLSIRSVGREAHSVAVTRLLSSKNLRPTREAVSILHALAASPYDAARAVHQLAAEDETEAREIRPDELRYALATLEAEQLVPNLPPTVAAVVHALLRTTGRLSTSELADVADVSTRSIRGNRDRLEALGLVLVDDRGWRLALSFQTTAERRAPITPSTVEGALLDAVDALLETVLPPERYGDLEDPLGGVLFWPPDPWVLVDESASLAPWVELAARLTGAEHPTTETAVRVGPEIEQTPLPGQPTAG